MRLSVKIGFGVIVLLFFSLTYWFFLNKPNNGDNHLTDSVQTTIYGKGKLITLLNKSEDELDGVAIKIRNAGYFEGNLNDISSVMKEKKLNNYIIADIEVKNNNSTLAEIREIRIFDSKDNPYGISVFVSDDTESENFVNRGVVRERKLLINNRDLLPGEVRRGAVYIPVKKIKESEEIKFIFGNEISLDAKITNKGFADNELKNLEGLRKLNEENIKIGNLEEGIVINNENSSVESENIETVITKSLYFDRAPEEFFDELGHLTSVGGNEKVILLGVKITNLGNKDGHIGKFFLKDNNNNVIEAIKTIGMEEVADGVVSNSFMERYKLLNYKGLGPNMKPLKAGESIEGNLIFYSSDIKYFTDYNFFYKGLSKKSKSIKVSVY